MKVVLGNKTISELKAIVQHYEDLGIDIHFIIYRIYPNMGEVVLVIKKTEAQRYIPIDEVIDLDEAICELSKESIKALQGKLDVITMTDTFIQRKIKGHITGDVIDVDAERKNDDTESI